MKDSGKKRKKGKESFKVEWIGGWAEYNANLGRVR